MNQQQKPMEEFDPNYRPNPRDFKDFDDYPAPSPKPTGPSRSLEVREEKPLKKKGKVKLGDFNSSEETEGSTSAIEQEVVEEQRGFPLQKKDGIKPEDYKTFEEARVLVSQENTDDAEAAIEPEAFEQVEPLPEVFLSAKDIGKKLERSSEFQEMKSLVVRRENALVEITTTQQEIIRVRSMVKRLNQELKDAEGIRVNSLALARGSGEEVSQTAVESIENVFASKKHTIDAQKANLQAQFDRLNETYANQKREFLLIDESTNTIRDALRKHLDKEINRIEVATNLGQEQGNFDVLKTTYDKALKEMAALERQIELFKALKKIDKQGKKEFNAQIEINEQKIAQIKSDLKEVEKDLVTAAKLLGGINKRIDSIEAIKKTKGIEEVKDFRSNQGSFEEFAFEDPIKEEAQAQELNQAPTTQTQSQTPSAPSVPESSGRTTTVVGRTRAVHSSGGGRREIQLPTQKLGSKVKSWFNKFFSLWG